MHLFTVYRTVFGVCVALVVCVIRFSFYNFLDRVLFHYDLHHDSCDRHWDCYGHSLIFELHFQTFCNLVVLVLHRRLDIPSPWTFSLNIGLHMLPSDSIMSRSLIGYYTGDFQALQLHVLAAFGAVD